MIGYQNITAKIIRLFGLNTLFYALYIVVLYLLALLVWPYIDVKEFHMYHYNLDVDLSKFVSSIFMAFFLLIPICRKYSRLEFFSDQVIMLLLLFYFLPGIVISGVLNFERTYQIQYFLYCIALLFFDAIIGCSEKKIISFDSLKFDFVRTCIIIISFVYPFFLIKIFGKSLSISEIILTLNDPYGVRSASKELNVNWVILTVEYWLSYFSFIMITYYLKKKKYWLAVMFTMCGLFYFILQGKRIFFFFIVVAICLGIFKVSRKYLKYVFLGTVLIQVVEIFSSASTGLGMITNIFRRYALVPNIISTSYFDFFQNAEHDWLRGTFTHFFGLLGLESPYGYEINTLIGQKYYGFGMYANTGLFGGGYYEFGTFCIVVDTIMFVFVLRIIEKILSKAQYDHKLMFAIIWASLSINAPAIWSGCFKFSQYSLLLLSLFFFFNRKETGEKYVFVKNDVR